MTLIKKRLSFLLSFFVILLLMSSCEDDSLEPTESNVQLVDDFDSSTFVIEEEMPLKWKRHYIESYSPGYVKVGDTVHVIGFNLSNATVKVGNQDVKVFSETVLSDDNVKLSFVIMDDIVSNSKETINSNFISLEYQDGIVDQFSFPLVVNYLILVEDLISGGWLENKTSQMVGDTLVGPSQLLITDFDNGGIRNALDTDDFSEVFLWNVTQTGGVSSISALFTGVKASPANGSFYGFNIALNDIKRNTNGFAAELGLITKQLNNQQTDWPVNFSEYPNSPIELHSSSGDLYLNFCVFKNGKQNGGIIPYVYSVGDGLADRLRYNDLHQDLRLGSYDWEWVSISINDLRNNFGYGQTKNSLEDINNLSIVFFHSDYGYDGLESNSEEIFGSGDVEVYMDHIIITEGNPFYGQPR